MIRKSIFAIAASVMTLGAFAATQTALNVQTGRPVPSTMVI